MSQFAVKEAMPRWFPFLGFSLIHHNYYRDLGLDTNYRWEVLTFQWFGFIHAFPFVRSIDK